MTTSRALSYLPHIDGLRAIAVISVILYHLNPAWLPGGFVGVDVFFVLSGYLITGKLADDLAADHFSIKEFYRRRIKRIAPLALLVIGCTLLFGYAVMLPDDMVMLAKSAVWSLGSMANVYFLREVDRDYFAPGTDEFPLLHLWSLGVEEQFYIIWPLIFYLVNILFKKDVIGQRRALIRVATIGCVVSIALSVGLSGAHGPFSFYMLPTRAFELMIGALLALCYNDEAVVQRVKRYAVPAMVAGILGLALSFCFINNGIVFPGSVALVPVVSTALLIAVGIAAPNGFATRMLCWKPATRIGIWSYAAYLWHWPLLAFFHYLIGKPGVIACIVLLLTTFAMAALSHRLVETPARKWAASFWKLATFQYFVPAAIMVSICIGVVYAGRAGISVYSETYLTQVATQRKALAPALGSEVCQRQRLEKGDLSDKNCLMGHTGVGKPEVLVFGDSHAAHYVPMIDMVARRAGYQFRNLEVGGCPPVLDPTAAGVDPKRRDDCARSVGLIWSIVKNYPVVMLGASWSGYDTGRHAMIKQLRATVLALQAQHVRVVLLAKIPTMGNYDRLCPLKKIHFSLLECAQPLQPLAPDVAAVNADLAQLAESLPDVKVFDPTSYVCTNGLCASQSPTGVSRYYDKTHLLARGSIEIGQAVLARQGVPAPLDVCDRVACRPDRTAGQAQFNMP